MKKLPIFLLLVCLFGLSACSTKKNTAGSRFWHSFTARFNTYFNGSEAYKEGMLAKEKATKDNFTEMLPYFLVGNEAARQAGSGNFETTVEKCEKAIQLHSIKKRPQLSANKKRTEKVKAYMNRKEFNPFLKRAWLLMGQAQFQSGEFLEAASTFSYITRFYAAEPDVVAAARVWLARCYSELEWFYDAEDVISRLGRDSVPPQLRLAQSATLANLLLRQGRFEEALPHLRETARKEKSKLQKARLYFLLGQVESQLGNRQAAYKALAKCIRQSPPYEMSFNARILQTEVLSDGANNKKMIAKLRRMARSDNNKDFLDQVYYAMGNIYLSEADTANAVAAYEKGREKSTRNGVEKGVLMLRLAEIYWGQKRYDLAQGCYNEALALIDKEHEQYEEVTRRSEVLDELVPFTSAIHLQDSLQVLARMSETDRNAAIDRVIEALKKKEEEERRAREDSAAEARAQENSVAGNAAANRPTMNRQPPGDKSWYFYNRQLVMQGKQDFQKQWGKRANEDNWRRSNRSVLAMESDEGVDYAAEDSIAAAEALADSIAAVATDSVPTDSAALDPHKREYYLAQIPFTEEAKAASDAIIMDALYNAGIIEKDELEDFPLAAETFTRLYSQYPEFENLEDVYYQLFLLYSRWQQPERAAEYRLLMQRDFPESAVTRLISDPDFERNARYARELEDSLYTATYNAYRTRDNAIVASNFAQSTERYPNGLNRPKFIFVHALSRLGTVSPDTLAKELRELVTQFPESDVSEMAGMIVKGLESGRTPGSGTFDLGSLWSRRSADAAATDSATVARGFQPDRDVPFVFLIAYPTDSLDDNRLLYDVAHFNFTGFMVRNFDMSLQRDPAITQFRVSGFNSFDEAHVYAQKIFAEQSLQQELEKARVFIISAANLALLGTTFSYDDYQKFYDETFAPSELDPALPAAMEEPVIEQRYEDEFSPEELEQMNEEEEAADDEGEWYSE